MTLAEAIEHPGCHVIYTHPETGARESGVICHARPSTRGLV